MPARIAAATVLAAPALATAYNADGTRSPTIQAAESSSEQADLLRGDRVRCWRSSAPHHVDCAGNVLCAASRRRNILPFVGHDDVGGRGSPHTPEHHKRFHNGGMTLVAGESLSIRPT